MTRQEEFKMKLDALLKEYDVTMTVEEICHGYHWSADGINFYSYKPIPQEVIDTLPTATSYQGDKAWEDAANDCIIDFTVSNTYSGE